jgi:hypothetical protein
MAVDATKVRVAVTGAVNKGLTSATAPTGTAATLTGFTELGYVSEDGVTLTLPGSGDSDPIKAWQNGATVRTIRTPNEDNPQYSFVLLETSLPVIELYFNATTSGQTASEGAVAYNASTQRSYFSFVVDVVDGAELVRDYIPRGIVTEVGDQVFANGEPIGYEITIEAEYDTVKTYNLKRWATALKS